jgi:acetyltransferase-like isoleucine patch superfamily enzyme
MFNLKEKFKILSKKVFLRLYPKPLGINMGKDSIIMLPRRINGTNFIKLGDDTIITENGWISAYKNYKGQFFNPSIIIGDGVRVGPNVMITSINKVEIKDGCLLSAQVFISDHSHGYQVSEVSPNKQELTSKGPVIIGKNCFIGIRASIMSGVTLGDHCVVGAHSVVTKSFPACSVVAGVPAKLIKTLEQIEKQ